MKFETNSMFLICMFVACGSMDSLKDMAVNKFMTPIIFQWGKCVINFLAYW